MSVGFHQEKIIDGVLSYRKRPQDGWTAMTSQELTEKIDTLLYALQKESVRIEEDLRKTHTEELVNAKKLILAEERKRIVSIIETEEELVGSPPAEWKPAEWKAFVRMDRVDLCRLVVRATKESIKEKVTHV